MTARATVLYRNLADAGTVTATSESPLLPATFLQSDHVAEKWSALSGATSAAIICDLGSALSIGCIALFGVEGGTSLTTRARASNSDATGVTGEIFDSTSGSTAYDDATSSIIYLFSAVSARYVRVDISVATETIKAGRLVIGPTWQPSRDIAFGFTRFWAHDNAVVRSQGGQEWIRRQAERRGFSVSFEAMTDSDFDTSLVDLARRNGNATDILFCVNPSATPPLGPVSLWGLITNVISGQRSIPDHYSVAFDIEERL